MARNKTYREAEKKIEKARRSRAKELDLRARPVAAPDEKLTELPELLGQLTQLQSLHLSGNQLTALPESLGQLTQLQNLVVNNNQLTTLPTSIGKLTNLK